MSQFPTDLAKREVQQQDQQTAQLNNKVTQLKLNEAQGAIADRDKLKGVYQQYGNDPDKLIPAVAAIDPEQAGKIQEQSYKTQAQQLLLQKTQNEHHMLVAEQTARDLLGVHDAQSMSALADSYEQSGVDQMKAMAPTLRQMSTTWDDASEKRIRDHVRDVVLPAKDNIELQMKQGDEAAKALAEKTSKAPEVAKQWTGYIAGLMGKVTDQMSLDQVAKIAQEAGVPATFLKLIPSEYSKENVDATRRMGITPTSEENHPVDPLSNAEIVARWAKEHNTTPDAIPYAQRLSIIGEKGRADDKQQADPNAAIAGNFALQGNDFLATIPVSWRNTVKKIASYEEDPTKSTSLRGTERSAVMRWVVQYNPDYKADEFANRAPTRIKFTTGVQGQQVAALNTAILHLDVLGPLIAKLDNGNSTDWNAFKNEWKKRFGSDAPTNFETLKDALAGEVAGVLSKGSATVSGIADEKAKMGTGNSFKQLSGYIHTLIPTMGSKAHVLDQQYHQAMGASDPWRAIFPEQRDVLKKYGYDSETGQSIVPLGTRGTPAPPAVAAALKDDAQYPRGKPYQGSSGKTYFKHEDGSVTLQP